MKTFHLFTFLLLLLPCFGFSKTKVDTLTNWQVYQDDKILFQSHLNDIEHKIALMNKKEDFKALKIQVNNCVAYADEAERTVEFFYKNESIAKFTDINRNSVSFEVTKEELLSAINSYLWKELTIKYYDSNNQAEIELGKIHFSNTDYSVLQIDEMKEVLQLALDLPALQEMFHIDTNPEGTPLYFQEFGWINSKYCAGLMKFGTSIQLISEEEIENLKIRNYISIGDWTPVGNSLRLQLYYSIEGLMINYMFEKNDDIWEITDSVLMEN